MNDMAGQGFPAIAALFFICESDVFIETRLCQLKMTDEEKEAVKAICRCRHDDGICPYRDIGMVYIGDDEWISTTL